MKNLITMAFFTFLYTTIMAKEVKTEILIKAAPEKVWAILTNFENYPNWNPLFRCSKKCLTKTRRMAST